MKLARVSVTHYRSLFCDSNRASAIDAGLGAGMNAFVGPNNCGKSNIIRATALALDPDVPFDREKDKPGPLNDRAVPRITLEFRQTEKRGSEATLFRYLKEYEQSVLEPGMTTWAEQGVLRFYVSFPGTKSDGTTRRELFLTREGVKPGDPDLLERAIRQFRERAIRFVLVESGADLAELLRGKFREILHTVLTEHLKDEYDQAKSRHLDYVSGVQTDLLAPLGKRIGLDVGGLFPEITSVELLPDVRRIDETLENVGIRLTDAVTSSLESKGTGVRGGVLIAMLRYLADNSRRSMVFAVEEPEAFLHPSAQEDLRQGLEGLAARDDVTLLVTTHSPFVLSGSPDARIFSVAKDSVGRTQIDFESTGADPRSDVLGGIFRSRALADAFDRAHRTPAGARATVVVEGQTDVDFLVSAAKIARREDLIRDLYFMPASGAKQAATQFILTKARSTLPVIAVFDSDLPGNEAYKQLKNSEISVRESTELLSYAAILDVSRSVAVEAEDLLPERLLEAFVERHGEELVVSEKIRSRPLGRWHYGFNKLGKELLPEYVASHATVKDVQKLLACLEEIRRRLGLSISVDDPAAGVPA